MKMYDYVRHRWLFGLAMAFLALLTATGARAEYPLATIKNNTEYNVTGMVIYASAFCKDDAYTVPPGGTWQATSRGVCLITQITGTALEPPKHGESTAVVPYDSTGTSFSQFQINSAGGQYRIFSENEVRKFSQDTGKSPGFKLVNKTDWPIAYSLEQVACLYHDVIPSRFNGRDGVRVVNSGAVWFTLRAHLQPDGINPLTDFDCIEPVAEIVGAVLLGVVETVVTGSPKGSAIAITKTLAKQAAKEAIKISIKELSKSAVNTIGKYLAETGTVTMAGQFAGYAWPFRCDLMPEYHITGGPKLLRDENGEMYIGKGTPLTVAKVNTCGNDMMPASPTRVTAKDAKFPDNLVGQGQAPSAGGGNTGNQAGNNTQQPANQQVFMRFQNRWKTDQFLHVENGPPQSGPIQPGWQSAQWQIEPVPGANASRLKNRWTGAYLHVQNGVLEAGPVDPGWFSAMWQFEQAPDGGFFRIKNRWTGVYLNIENGTLQAGNVDPGWWSAMWLASQQ